MKRHNIYQQRDYQQREKNKVRCRHDEEKWEGEEGKKREECLFLWCGNTVGKEEKMSKGSTRVI